MTILVKDGTVPVVAYGGRSFGIAATGAAASPDLGYLLRPVVANGEVTLQIDAGRSSPGVTALRICGPGRIYTLNGTEAISVPLGDLTDDPDAPVLPLTVEAVTAGGRTGPMTDMVLVDMIVEEPEPEPEPDPDPEDDTLPPAYVERGGADAAGTVTLPAGIVEGDLVVAFAMRGNVTLVAAPDANWAPVDTAFVAETANSQVFHRFAPAGGMTGALTFANANAVQIIVLRGVNPTTPIRQHARISGPSATTVAMPALPAMPNGNSIVLSLGYIKRNGAGVALAHRSDTTGIHQYVTALGVHTTIGYAVTPEAWPSEVVACLVNTTSGHHAWVLEIDGTNSPIPQAASITAPASLTVGNPWDEGDAFTVNTPTISGTPSAGPTVTWEFRPATGGDWTPGAAWTGTVPVIAEAMDVRLVTTITPGAGQAPVSATSDVYRAIPAPAPEIPPAPLTAAQITVTESVYRPGAQTVTFSPRVQFPGLTFHTMQFCAEVDFSDEDDWHPVTLDEDDEYELFATGHPITPPAYDAALWTEQPADRLARLRFRYKEASDGLWSAASDAVTVPLPPEVEPTLGAPSEDMVTLAITYRQTNGPQRFLNNHALGTNDTNTSHVYIIPPLAAWKGSTQVVGGQTPAQATIAQFGVWDTQYPSAYGGIRGQRDFFFICATALAKITPAVWNALGGNEGGPTPAGQKARLDLMMRASLVSFMWQMSDTNFFILNGGQQVTIRGDNQWGRGFNPNFTLPGEILPWVIAQYMGGPDVANAFLTTYNHNNFVAEITALRNAAGGGGLQDVLLTFNTLGAGVTAARLTAALKGPGGNGPPTIWGNTLADTDNAIARALSQRMWPHPIQIGCTAWPNNINIPTGFNRPANGTFGIFEPTAAGAGPGAGRNAQVGRLAAGAPAHPRLGQLGMAFELNAKDGGTPPSGGGPRCAVKYAMEGAVLAVAGVTTLVAQNALSRVHAGIIDGLERQDNGIFDIEFRFTHGNRDFSKAGRPWAGTNNNGNADVNQAWADARLYSLTIDTHKLIVLPWALG